MLGYTLRRVALLFLIMWLVVTLVFLVLRLGPGDPTYAILGKYASAEAQENLREQLGLNKPIYFQYLEMLQKLVTFNFGKSLVTDDPIWGLISHDFPYSIILAIASMTFGSLLGIALGVLAAAYVDTIIDHLLRICSLIFPSMPAYYLGVLLILFLSFRFPIFPATGAGESGKLISQLRHLILPAVTLGLVFSGEIARITRTAMLEVKEEVYVQVARSKGLTEFVILFKHVLRNSLIPVITVIGVDFGVLIGMSVLVEDIFVRPGLGSELVTAALAHDYPVVEVIIVVFAFIVASLNLIVDLSYYLLNPAIRY